VNDPSAASSVPGDAPVPTRQGFDAPAMTPEEQQLTDRFARMYYDQPVRTWQNTFWFGVRIVKNPLDMWIYQEILSETRPDVIVECGTAYGGSALYLANLCDLMGHGFVVTVDIVSLPRPQHQRIAYLTGSTTDPDVFAKVVKVTSAAQKVMVILDSDHSAAHVLRELELYADLVTPGCYLLVEDTSVNHPFDVPGHGPGPMEALEQWLPGETRFTRDSSREKFFFTFNPKGYLLRR
jgi:cephalosporin hydroxylase